MAGVYGGYWVSDGKRHYDDIYDRSRRKLSQVFEKIRWSFNSYNAAKWETLGKVANSRLGQVTILMPFIGYLIILNPSVSPIFDFGLPVEDSQVPELLLLAYQSRLNLLYFGLLFLGLGSTCFHLFAPNQIKSFGSQRKYLSEMEAIKSDSLIREVISEICIKFLRCNKGDFRSPFFAVQSKSFPNKPSGYLHDLISDIVSEIDPKLIPTPRRDITDFGTMSALSRHVFHIDGAEITTGGIIERVFESGITSEMAFIHSIHHEAIRHSHQIFFIDYLSANYQNFAMRSVTLILLGIGFGLLLIPTVTTSAMILLSVDAAY